jgi:hypothetical protein
MIAQTKTPPPRQPDLVAALHDVVAELVDTANTLASVATFAADLGPNERLSLLYRLARVTLRLRKLARGSAPRWTPPTRGVRNADEHDGQLHVLVSARQAPPVEGSLSGHVAR